MLNWQIKNHWAPRAAAAAAAAPAAPTAPADAPAAPVSPAKVSDYREAAQLAESFFCTPAWEAKHKDGVINQVVVFASDAKDMVERPTVEPTYSTLVGQKKSYSYLPSSPRKRR